MQDRASYFLMNSTAWLQGKILQKKKKKTDQARIRQ